MRNKTEPSQEPARYYQPTTGSPSYEPTQYNVPRFPRASRPPDFEIPDLEIPVTRVYRQSLRVTYLRASVAIVVLGGLICAVLTNDRVIRDVQRPLLGFALGSSWCWAVVLAAYAVGFGSVDRLARRAKSRVIRYAGLTLYLIAAGLVFVPLLSTAGAQYSVVAAFGWFSSVALVLRHVIQLALLDGRAR